MKPLVSVLMTAYNREKYLAEAIESVLQSTYTNFELIIVDDCSNDLTVNIARSYAAKDERIKLYVNEINLGDYVNRNKAASYAKGEYLKYVDSDDIIYPHGLEVMINAMERFPESPLGIISNTGQEHKPFPFLLSPAEAYEKHFFKGGLFEIGPTGLIFKTKVFKQMGGFSGKRYISDCELSLKIASQLPVIKIASSLVYWRRHETQEFNIGVTTMAYLELTLPMYQHALMKDECPMSEKEKKSILKLYRKAAAREVLKVLLKHRNPRLALKLYKNLALKLLDLF